MGVTRTWTGCLGLLLLGVAVTACGDDDVNAVATTAASEEPVSGTLVVTCTADTTEVDGGTVAAGPDGVRVRSEEHTSELQSLMRISYAVFCLKKKTKIQIYKIQGARK